MTKKTATNLLGLAILAFLLTFLTGGVNAIPFAGIKGFVVKDLHSTSAAIGYSFSVFMFGYLIGVIFNGIFIRFIKPKYTIYFAIIIYVIASLLLYSISSAFGLSSLMILMGFGIGVAYTIPNYIIVNSFEGKSRSSILNAGDFFYSVGGFAIPIISGLILSRGGSWIVVFLSLFIVLIIIAIITIITKFPNFTNSQKHDDKDFVPVVYSKWNLNVYLMIIMIFFYLMSYMGFSFWIISYLMKNFNVPIGYAVYGYSLFWIFYAIGCFISSFAVRVIKVHKYIMGSMCLAIVAYILLYFAGSAGFYCVAICILGFGCATVFSSSIGYGSQLIKTPSPMFISILLAGATVGSLVGETLSSYVQSAMGMSAVTVMSGIYMIIALLILSVIVIRNNRNPAES